MRWRHCRPGRHGHRSTAPTEVTATVRAQGTLRRAWTLHDLTGPGPEGDRSYRCLLEYHCPEARYRSLQALFFSGAMGGLGRMTGRSSQPDTWRAVKPDSVSASIMTAICSRP